MRKYYLQFWGLKLLVIITFTFCADILLAQNASDIELNRLWNQANFWEKAGNTVKTIECKEKLLDLYKKHYLNELPFMLRNIANTYASLSEPFWDISDNYFKDALTIISERPRTDENYSLYYDCLGDIIGYNFERKNYSALLKYIETYGGYITDSRDNSNKEEAGIVRKWKYNTIQLLNDSCQILQNNKEYISAQEVMSQYVSEFISVLNGDSMICDISNLCLSTVWQYANIIENIGKIDKSFEFRELVVSFFRKHSEYYCSVGIPKDYLWSMERFLANKYAEKGNFQREIELSYRIVQEARESKDSLLLSKKLIDLGVSYEHDHTKEGREKAQRLFEESLDVLSKLPDSREKQNTILGALEFMAAEYVLCSQYNKAVELFDSYHQFLMKIDNKYDNEHLINVLSWKSSTFQHLNFSIQGSREEAQKINDEILEYQRRNFGEESIQFLSQLRTCTFAYEDSDTLELNDLFNHGYYLWQRIPQKEKQPEYASFLTTFITYKYSHDISNSYRQIEDKLDSLCSTPYVNFHTKINYLINRSINEYNHCQYELALQHIEAAQCECYANIENSEMMEKMAQIYNHKSRISFCLGNYDSAKKHAYAAFEFIEKSQYDNLLKSEILYSLSYLMENFGEKEEAMNMAIEAFNVYYKCEGNSTPLDVISSTINRFDPSTQISLLDSLHIENFLDNPKVIDLLLAKATAYMNVGKLDSANYFLLQAEKYIDIYKSDSYYRTGDRFNQVKSQLLYNRGVLSFWKKDYHKAISYLKDYRSLLESEDPLPWLNTLYAIVKDSVNFENETRKSLDYIRKEISERFVYLSDHERELYMTNKLSSAIEEIEAYACIYPELEFAKKAAFEAVLLEKGIALSASTEIQKIMNSSSVDTKHLMSLRNQFNMASDKESRISLQLKISLEEQKLQDYVGPKIEDYINSLLVDINEIKENIDAQTAVVEFIRVLMPNKTNYTYIYGALILTKELESPIYVNIGTEHQIEFVKRKKSSIYANDNELYNLLWNPIVPFITDKKLVYFSPTGLLHLLNIELIAHNHLQNIDFVRLSSSREICHKKGGSNSNSIVLFGGLCYDCELAEGKFAQETINIESLNSSTTRGDISFLPGSLCEINCISKIATTNKKKSTVYSGEKGSELNYKNLSGKETSILHISTHGFSLGHENISEFGDPMRRCGLLLSSSLQAWNGNPRQNAEDGILLGEEIANVSLQQNDLVVLSACETALGVTTTEGVWGLQRAFKKAGAGSIIMSLWKVDDVSTRLFMTEFYKNYLSGRSKQESFKMAQKHVRNYTDENGVELFRDPAYWAAFIILDGLN